MTEKFQQNEGVPELEVGELVKLNPDLDENQLAIFKPQLMPGETYKIFHISKDSEDGSVAAHVGPLGLDVNQTEAIEALNNHPEIFSISVSYLVRQAH